MKSLTSCNTKGFTLVELLIVVAIIGILSSTAALVMNKQIEKANLVKLAALARYLSQDISGISSNFDLTHRWTATPYTGGVYKTNYLNGALQEMWEKGKANTNLYGHKNPFSKKMVVLDATSITTAYKNPAIFISYNNTRFPYTSYVTNTNAAGAVIVHITNNSMKIDVYYTDSKGVKSQTSLQPN